MTHITRQWIHAALAAIVLTMGTAMPVMAQTPPAPNTAPVLQQSNLTYSK